MNTPQNLLLDSIAIVGIGCRFPGAHGPQAFWQLLASGFDAITEVPRNRFDIDKFYDPTPGVPGKISSRYGGFIDLVDHFDAEFFGISPREAEAIDPQQRLVLEVAHEALEDAGLPPDNPCLSAGGVFLGLMSNDYLNHIYRGALDLDLTLATASSRAAAATRISRMFNLEGPSLTIDSDRASSLTAIHFACRSLSSGECAVALAGAANLILGPELSIACSRSGLLSTDGRCRFCDAGSNGIGRSEGVGVLVLKRVADALADGSRIYAIIRGSAVRSNGSSSSDMLRPSVQAQVGVLRAALRDAGVRPEEIQYVEAHGTGTRLGDQVEIQALGAVFGQSRSADRPCLIGSVKTNVGHAEAAAGMAGLIKVALALQHGSIPKNLHTENLNPELALPDRHLQIPVQTVPWPASGLETGFAGVSSFGLTGSLAHVVLQAPPPQSEELSTSTAGCYYLLPLSAPSQEGLAAVANTYREWLRDSVPKSLPRLGYSAGLHRQHHPHRLAVVASSLQEVTEQLNDYLDGREPYQGASGHVTSGRPKLAFIFPGQGSQWAGMGRELMASESVFRDTIASCDDIISAEAGWSVAALLRGPADSALLQEIDYVQPALTAVMVGLAALWRSWGIHPDAVLGLSMGEAAAAYVAGILDLHETMAIVCRRSRLMKRMRGQGAIASIPLSQAEVEPLLIPYSHQLSLAVVASPSTTMVSGNPGALRKLIEDFGARGIGSKHIKVDVASHSAQMDGLLEELREQLHDLRPKPGSIPLLSTVDAVFLDGSQMGADYWARNLRQPVLQMNGFAQLLNVGYSAFLELSPHPIVWHPLLETIQMFGAQATIATSLRRGEDERKSLLRSAGTLYARGISPDWKTLCGTQDQKYLPLPTYPWQSKPYWYETAQEDRPDCKRGAPSKERAHPGPRGGVRTRLLHEICSASANQRKLILLSHLQTTIRRILKFSSDVPVLTDEPLRQMGLTSLMSAEFALELQSTLGCPCSATLLFNYPTLEQLADYLLSTTVLAPHIDLAENVSLATKPGSISSPTVADAPKDEAIAVVGMACRFPGGSDTPDDYWRILHNGIDVISEVPAKRWNIEDFYDPNPETPGRMCTRWAGFLTDIDCFDASYFGLSRREAEVLDPHQRLLLEVAVEALENSGRSPSSQPASNGGVFVGIMNNHDFASVKGTCCDPSRINAHDSTGQATSAAAGRLSYTLGFQGPCLAVDTACSSSLVAVHLACQALRAGECEFALAGGVNVILAPETTIAFSKTRMLSPTGRCKTFDARADGYVRGEGCGMVVLKRLSDAIRDRDNVLALIRGSAVNQDGRSSSLTAPNGLAQQAVIRRALQVAGVHPTEVDYIEAHGTGTALGDPIEIEALGNVLADGRDPAAPFLVGSVKTNIGHLEAAAGVASLIKVILSVQHEEIPPHLHLEEVNPRISLATSKALIPTQPTPWPRGGKRRIAGISSFGFVGTNAHLVLEEPPERAENKLPRPVYRLLGLSAPSPRGVREVAGRYASLLSRRAVDVDDLCHTANVGRAHHSSRAAFITASIDDLRMNMHSFVKGGPVAGTVIQAMPSSSVPKVAFLFTGQGAQYPGMATQLFMTEPRFKATLERCAEIMDPLLPRGLLSLMQDHDPGTLHQTRFAQPALFALECALFEQWRGWGVEPSLVMGHSLGECAAAVAAGIMSLEHAAKLVVTRGNLMHSIMDSCGSASVFASEKFVQRFVQPYASSVAIAADNGPERVLIAGEEKPLQAVCAALESAGVEVRRMAGPLAAHCPMMDPILGAFEAASATTAHSEPQIPLVSTLTGRLVNHQEISNPRHWSDHIRNKVRFREGMQTLYTAGCRIFVEIGPRHTLLNLGKLCLPFPEIAWLPSLSKEKHDQQQILESLAELYVRGVRVRWEDRHRSFRGDKIPLPTTSFERTRFWPDKVPRASFSRLESTPTIKSETSDSAAAPRPELQKQASQILPNEATPSADKLRSLSPQERHSAILEHVIETVRSVTAMKESETVPLNARFDDLGVDSLLSLDLIGTLENSLDTSIPSTIFSNCPTIDSLATYLFGEVSKVKFVSAAVDIESEISSLPETAAIPSVPVSSD